MVINSTSFFVGVRVKLPPAATDRGGTYCTKVLCKGAALYPADRAFSKCSVPPVATAVEAHCRGGTLCNSNSLNAVLGSIHLLLSIYYCILIYFSFNVIQVPVGNEFGSLFC